MDCTPKDLLALRALAASASWAASLRMVASVAKPGKEATYSFVTHRTIVDTALEVDLGALPCASPQAGHQPRCPVHQRVGGVLRAATQPAALGPCPAAAVAARRSQRLPRPRQGLDGASMHRMQCVSVARCLSPRLSRQLT